MDQKALASSVSQNLHSTCRRHGSTWWKALCVCLKELKEDPGYITTTKVRVKNWILVINEEQGYIDLRSERSRTGEPRRITIGMLRSTDTTTHGVIVGVLRGLMDIDKLPSPGWVGPFLLRTLIENCLDDNQSWPPDDGVIYLVSKSLWTEKEPNQSCSPLYIGTTTGKSERFCTRIGDLIADLLGFCGETTGHHTGGQWLYEWSHQNDTHPLDLYISWYVDESTCKRCEERRWYQKLRPLLNKQVPSCPKHPQANWDTLWGVAGCSNADEVDSILDSTDGLSVIERALRS